ncbi:hypothetical protein [Pseudomonas sp. B21-053]|uniref:hypothetical protein n=1 Tax=Pseudomonas sp. B21-053 TaxID=2895493 RepID=UPI0022302F54|nr:hypothetical protein [Pseudomonas sp. B21-053]UZE14752.1 hypothetical protein LOY68_14460 [Pseudomonas sp. B21-053]
MRAVIYAGLRNGARDQQIFDALTYKHVIEVAKDFQLAPSTIRAAAKRISNAVVFELSLLGGAAQCLLGKSPPTHSAKQRSAPTATTTEPSETLSCHAG